MTNGEYRKQVDRVMGINHPDSYYTSAGVPTNNNNSAREIAKLKRQLRKEKQKAIKLAVEQAASEQKKNEVS